MEPGRPKPPHHRRPLKARKIQTKKYRQRRSSATCIQAVKPDQRCCVDVSRIGGTRGRKGFFLFIFKHLSSVAEQYQALPNTVLRKESPPSGGQKRAGA
jgi:hypothetical protein